MKEQLKINDFRLIHSMPTCGKSTLAAIYNTENFSVLDTDTLCWGWALSKEDSEFLESDKVVTEQGLPWHSKGALGKTFNIVRNSQLMYANLLMVKYPDLRTVTSLAPTSPKFLKTSSLSVAREPQDMYDLAKKRAEAKGKPFKASLEVYKSWFESWEKHRAKWKTSIILEPGQYLTDVFDLDAKIVDPKQVDAINYGKFYEWVAKQSLDLYVAPQTRDTTRI